MIKNKTTLRRRLLLFFIVFSLLIVITFTALLALFGITKKDERAIKSHINSQLINVSNKINHDFAQISLKGVSVASDLIKISDDFFSLYNTTANDLKNDSNLIEPLLSLYMDTLLSTAENTYCGGVFVILDAKIAPTQSNNTKAGIFIKKVLPTATTANDAQLHFLRGPAQLARNNGLMLLGQWQMEFDISGQNFFDYTLDTARKNPNLPLQYLYFWSSKVQLKNNSEAGFLLCVPLRSADNSVFGMCGIEVSDRLFKTSYTPLDNNYGNIFSIMAPISKKTFYSSNGLIAGNYYLTGSTWDYNLKQTEYHNQLYHFSGENKHYGGLFTKLHLYSNNSPFINDEWALAVLMSKQTLHDAISQSHIIYFIIILLSLIISFTLSVFISKHYIKPITQAITSIKNKKFEANSNKTFLEISDLFKFLAQNDYEYESKLLQQNQAIEDLQESHENALNEIKRLAYNRKTEIDPDNYQLFIDNLHTLTKTEKLIFDYYVEGKTAAEIMSIMKIKETTIKYHNQNIYSKLGVTSKKELLRYISLMGR